VPRLWAGCDTRYPRHVSTDAFAEEMRSAGHPTSEWANGPGFEYAPHSHRYRKMLQCLEGSIVFHLPDRDVALAPGDRMVVDPGVQHGATVGPSGVRCVEAHVS
jgi:mannose-6-phosphate isomerase-like protein (cupin superfamily)